MSDLLAISSPSLVNSVPTPIKIQSATQSKMGLMPRKHYFPGQHNPIDFTNHTQPIELTVVSPDGKQAGYFLPHTKELKIIDVNTNQTVQSTPLDIPDNYCISNLTWLENDAYLAFEATQYRPIKEIIQRLSDELKKQENQDIQEDIKKDLHEWQHEKYSSKYRDTLCITDSKIYILNLKTSHLSDILKSRGANDQYYYVISENSKSKLVIEQHKPYACYNSVSERYNKPFGLDKLELYDPKTETFSTICTSTEIVLRASDKESLRVFTDSEYNPRAATDNKEIIIKNEKNEWQKIIDMRDIDGSHNYKNVHLRTTREFGPKEYKPVYDQNIYFSKDFTYAYTLRFNQHRMNCADFMRCNDIFSFSPEPIAINLATKEIKSLIENDPSLKPISLLTATEPPCVWSDDGKIELNAISTNHNWLVTWISTQDIESAKHADLLGDYNPFKWSTNKGIGLIHTGGIKNIHEFSIITMENPRTIKSIHLFKEIAHIRNSTYPLEARIIKTDEKSIEVYEPPQDFLLPTYITYPKNYNPQTSPFILFPHGGPISRDTYHYDPLLQFLADRGIGIIQVDYRGSNNHGDPHKWNGMGYAHTMVEDLEYVIKHLAKENILNSNNIAIMGHSHGGYLAYLAATTGKLPYKAFIPIAASADQTSPPPPNSDGDYQRLGSLALKYGVTEAEKAEKRKQVSPLFYFEKTNQTKPILIIAGDKDKIVPYNQSTKAADRLALLGRQVAEIKVKEEGHQILWRDPKNQEVLAGIIENFLGHIFHTEYEPLQTLPENFEVMRNHIPWLRF